MSRSSVTPSGLRAGEPRVVEERHEAIRFLLVAVLNGERVDAAHERLGAQVLRDAELRACVVSSREKVENGVPLRPIVSKVIW